MERPALGEADCSGAPRSRATVYSRTLQRACEALGGVQRLADHLKIPAENLARWIDAQGKPPLDVFLAAVEVVLLHADRSRGSA